MNSLSRRLLLGAGIGLLAGSMLNWLVIEEEYTSTATVRVVPSLVPERLVQSGMPLDTDWLTKHEVPSLLSRNGLTDIVQSHDLFRVERSRMPIDDVIELFRRRIEVRAESSSTLRLSVRYRDRNGAQRACRNLLSRLMDGAMRDREQQARMLVGFLDEESRQASVEWEASSKTARAEAGNERLALERDMARRQYESLRSRLAEAKLIAGLERRKQGPALDIVDPPSLPEHVTGWSRGSVLAAGVGVGLLLAVASRVVPWMRRRVRGRPAYGAAG